MYPSTEMFTSVQKYKLQYRKITPVLSTQITAPVQKNINLIVQKHKLQNKHIHWLCDYILQYSKIHVYNSATICIPVQKYKFQYKNKSFGTEKYFLKNLEKIGRYFIYDYYYVPYIYAYYSVP